jgi:hypothetical protein
MKQQKQCACSLAFFLLGVDSRSRRFLNAAETMQSLIAAAKNEDEITFVAGAQTFGGAKGSPIWKRHSTNALD